MDNSSNKPLRGLHSALPCWHTKQPKSLLVCLSLSLSRCVFLLEGCAMEDRIRFRRDTSRESKGAMNLQKKLAENTRRKAEPAPDLTDFMNDMFFGGMNGDKKAYNLTGDSAMDEDDDFDSSTRSNSSRMTQEWLEEARRVVASSPSRSNSPSRLISSPRFAAAHGSPPLLERRDPLSRSARRNKAVESFSGEILSKSAKHNRNGSESSLDTPTTTPPDLSSPPGVHKWFSNILKPPNSTHNPDPTPDPTALTLPPSRQPIHRKSRFQTDPSSPKRPEIPVPSSQRTFKSSTQSPETHVLSPPKGLTQPRHQRALSASSSFPGNKVLSPPRKLVESAHHRSIAASTCSTEKIAPKLNASHRGLKEEKGASDHISLNGFLKDERIKLQKVLNGESEAKAKIVLSGASNSTSSMVAAICYACLLQDRMARNKEEGDEEGFVVVPVMNVSRRRMWKHKQAAWLFHHVGVDATSLLFADEVDLGSAVITGKCSILVVGQDVLKRNGEVGSQCTILTDNYCEDAYDLLETPALKKLLLAGILLDTRNLNASDKSSMTRDSEAVQLLLVGLAPNYRYALFDQLMQEQRDQSFLEALHHNYGKPPTESSSMTRVDHKIVETKPKSISHKEDIISNPHKNPSNVRSSKTDRVPPKSANPSSLPAQPPKVAPPQTAPDASRAKPKFFLAKWFGFGSK